MVSFTSCKVNVAKMGAMSVFSRIKAYDYEFRTARKDGNKPEWNEVRECDRLRLLNLS